MERTRVNNFAKIEAEFMERVHSIVWCSFATMDTKNRPRSRILHPIWEGMTGWIFTWRDSLKSKHLAHNPYVSLAYVADIVKPVYVDCTAAWADDVSSKQHVWDLFAAAPEPLGYDPATIFQTIDHHNLGLLKLTPWRVEVVTFPVNSRIWQA